MKVLNAINSEEILTIDIETVRLYEKLEDAPEGLQSAWEYKNKQAGIIPDFDELSDLWERTASLYAEFSKVCAVSLAYLKDTGELRCKSYSGTNERQILEDLYNDLGLFQKSGGVKRDRLVGHAAKYFDYPFLCKRYTINGLDLPSILDVTDKKPWEQKNLCTNDLWKHGGTGPGSSLQALCVALEIPVSKVDLVGDEVGGAYFRGEIEKIATYCNYDSVATFNVFRRYKGEEIFHFEDVTYIKAENVEKIEPTIVDKIKDSGKLGKREANKIIKEFAEASIEEKKEVIKNVEALLLINNNKTQLKKMKTFEYLSNKLLAITA